MNLWPKMDPHFTLIKKHNLPYYPKEPTIFPYLRQYDSIPFLLNNPDTDLYQDILSNSPPPDDNNPLEQFQLQTSNKPIALPEPKSHLPPTYQSLPHSPLSHDNFDFPLTLLTQTLKSTIIPSILPPPFRKHFLVLLTRLNVCLRLLPLNKKLDLLIIELPTLRIIYVHFLLKTTTLPKLLSVSHLETMLHFVNWITCQTCHCIPSTQ